VEDPFTHSRSRNPDPTSSNSNWASDVDFLLIEENKITSLDSEHYYQPTSKNYLSLDSFVYDPDSHQINLFQVTVAKNHDLVSKGVQEVRELGQLLEIDLRIRIIVVLFGDVDIDFKVQMGLYDNWGLQTYVVQMTEDQLYPGP